MTVSAHAVISDDEGRPTPERGGVFTYLGLAPGTVLACDIVMPAGTGLRLAAGDALRLGRSRKDDFGQALVRDVRTVPGPGAAGLAAGEEVRVWCVSDVLLHDEAGASSRAAWPCRRTRPHGASRSTPARRGWLAAITCGRTAATTRSARR
jgi:hypothetical protein